MEAPGCRAVSSGCRRYDDTAVMAVTLSHEVRGPCWGVRVEFLRKVLSVHTHTDQVLVNQGVGARARGPGCFLSRPAPYGPATGLQADSRAGLAGGVECWQHRGSHRGRGRVRTGLWQLPPKCQPLVPTPEPGQDKTRRELPCPQPFPGTVCPMTQGPQLARDPLAHQAQRVPFSHPHSSF